MPTGSPWAGRMLSQAGSSIPAHWTEMRRTRSKNTQSGCASQRFIFQCKTSTNPEHSFEVLPSIKPSYSHPQPRYMLRVFTHYYRQFTRTDPNLLKLQ